MRYLMGYIAIVLLGLIGFSMFLVVNTYGLSIVSVMAVLYLSIYVALIVFMFKDILNDY